MSTTARVMVGVYRPPRDSLDRIVLKPNGPCSGYLFECPCGLLLSEERDKRLLQMSQHWSAGCFDTVIYKDVEVT